MFQMRLLEPGHFAFVAICHLLTTPKTGNSQNEKYIGVVPDPFPPTDKNKIKRGVKSGLATQDWKR